MTSTLSPVKRTEQQITWLTVLVNFAGASVTFFFMSVIDPQPPGEGAVRPIDPLSLIIFALFMLGLFVIGSAVSARVIGPVDKWRKRVAAGAPVSEIPPDIKRRLVNYPLYSTATTGIMWVVAGVATAILNAGNSLRPFIAIVGVGGVLTTAFYYFACDLLWRKALVIFFPDGRLSEYGGVRISVLRRLLVVFFLIGPYPLALLTYLSLSRAQAMLTAPNPQVILENLIILELFILAASLLMGVGMASFMGRGITDPLRDMQSAMQRVQERDFGARVTVTTNDELGYLGERFNQMTDGLRQGELLRNLLNVYVSPEVAREAIEHGARLGGETATCSVLFSDIRNFTGLSEQLPPQALIEMLNRYMSAMVDVVIAQGGIVNKFGGDSLLAVFGAPINPIGDHAARAICAAVEMRAALDRFNATQRQSGSVELSIGVGIASGPVIAGNVGGHGRLEYTVIGDTVNLASRLQSLTKEVGRHTLLNEAAYAAAQAPLHLAAEEMPPLTIRGKSEAVKVYAL